MLKTAREQAGLSQEEAAWKLHIGRRTLSDYENQKTLVPPDVLDAMAYLYKKPSLRNMYCTEYCPLGRLHDRIEDTEFSTAVLALINEHNHLGDLLKELIAIAADGKITEDELDKYKAVDREMGHLRQKITTLRMCAATQMVS